jgi:hypothetical protein
MPFGLAVLLVSARAPADEPVGPAPVPRAPAPVENRFSIKVSLGGDYRSLYGVPIYGGDARLGLGLETGLFTVYGTAGLTLGTTQYGLTTTIVDLGCSFERRFGPVTLGLPFRPSYLRVGRVTTSGALDSVGVGIAPLVGLDLFSSEGHVLFLAASMNLDEYLVGSNAFAWGPSLSIGYRESD